MFTNKSQNGLCNLCGEKIHQLRIAKKFSQRELAEELQQVGITLDKNAIQRIECGKRFVTDIEIVCFSKIFNVSLDYLLLEQPLPDLQIQNNENNSKK